MCVLFERERERERERKIEREGTVGGGDKMVDMIFVEITSHKNSRWLLWTLPDKVIFK